MSDILTLEDLDGDPMEVRENPEPRVMKMKPNAKTVKLQINVSYVVTEYNKIPEDVLKEQALQDLKKEITRKAPPGYVVDQVDLRWADALMPTKRISAMVTYIQVV